MNCHNECELFDGNHEEDPVSLADIKTEPQDIKIGVQTQLEKCKAKSETCADPPLASTFEYIECGVKSEADRVDIKQEIEPATDSSKAPQMQGTQEPLDQRSQDIEEISEDEDATSEEDEDATSEEEEEETNIVPLVQITCEAYGKHLNGEKCDICESDEKTDTYSNCDNSLFENDGTSVLSQSADKELQFNILMNAFSNITRYHLEKSVQSAGKPSKFTSSDHGVPTCSPASDRPFMCTLCGKSFYRKPDLTRHTRIHTAEKSFKCNICSKAFYRKFDLFRHTRIHTNEKPFTCNICNKSYYLNSHLKDHMRTHTNNRPFTCKICSKSFYRKSDVSRHSLTHTNDKSFKCNVCSMAFYRKPDLTRHTQVHTKDKSFKCNVCNASFNRKFALKRHIHTHESEKRQSQRCKAKGKDEEEQEENEKPIT